MLLTSSIDFIKIDEGTTPLSPFDCKLLFISTRLNSQAATTSAIFSLQGRRFFSNSCHVSNNWRKLLLQLPSRQLQQKSHKIFRKLKAKSAHVTFSKNYAACESKNARVASASLIPVLALPMVKNFFCQSGISEPCENSQTFV